MIRSDFLVRSSSSDSSQPSAGAVVCYCCVGVWACGVFWGGVFHGGTSDAMCKKYVFEEVVQKQLSRKSSFLTVYCQKARFGLKSKTAIFDRQIRLYKNSAGYTGWLVKPTRIAS